VVGVEVGQKAPDATLVNADRKFAKLSDLRGKPTVLLFFPGAFTGACTKEMCAIRDGLSKLNALNAQVVGISVDSPFAQKAFADANGLNFTLLSDYNREAVKAFDVQDPNFAGGTMPGVAWRSVFVLDKDGVVRWKWMAPAQGTEPDYAAVETAVKSISY
jgi:peroxiredoxin